MGAKVEGGETINGILTAKEAKESGDAVALSQEDLRGQNARAAGLLDADGHAVDLDVVRATLGTGAVPLAGRGRKGAVRPPVGRHPSFTVGETAQLAQTWRMGERGGVTLGQLVTARNTALLSSDPVCGPANACPAEFAANTSGANYDGAKLAEGGGRRDRTIQTSWAPL